MTTATAPQLAPVPPHVDNARVAAFDMFNVAARDGEYQLAVHPFQAEGKPEIFWTQSNGGHWVFTRAEDIEYALNHPEVYSATKMFVPREKNPTPPLTPLMIDPPDHGKFRAMIAPAFTPKATAELSDRAQKIAIELIEAIRPKGSCEFIHAFAERLPIDVFMGMMALPASDRDHLMLIGEHHVRPPTPQHHLDSMRQLQEYSLEKIRERRGGSGDDLITQLTRATFDGKLLDDQTLVGIIVLMLVAGLDTVAAQLGFFAKFLAQNPDHRRKLVANPDLIPKATEELLRRFAIATVGRILLRDEERRGVRMKAGDMVIMPTIFMNFDRSRFDNPLEVDFERRANLHGTFGRGVHQCVGSMLAKAELRIFVKEWLARIPEFHVRAGEEIAITSGTVSSIRRLPLEWDAR